MSETDFRVQCIVRDILKSPAAIRFFKVTAPTNVQDSMKFSSLYDISKCVSNDLKNVSWNSKRKRPTRRQNKRQHKGLCWCSTWFPVEFHKANTSYCRIMKLCSRDDSNGNGLLQKSLLRRKIGNTFRCNRPRPRTTSDVVQLAIHEVYVYNLTVVGVKNIEASRTQKFPPTGLKTHKVYKFVWWCSMMKTHGSTEDFIDATRPSVRVTVGNTLNAMTTIFLRSS